MGIWVFLRSLGSLACALWFVRFIQGCWRASLGSSGVVGFTSVRSRGRWFHPRSLGSLARALGVVGCTPVGLGCR